MLAIPSVNNNNEVPQSSLLPIITPLSDTPRIPNNILFKLNDYPSDDSYESFIQWISEKIGNDDILDASQLLDILIYIRDLIGLTKFKQEIMIYVRNLINHSPDRLHCCILGPSGDDKILVSSLLARIWKCFGFISNDNVRVVERYELIGRYVGESTQKIQNILNNSNVPVIMIENVNFFEQLSVPFREEVLIAIHSHLRSRNNPIIIFDGTPLDPSIICYSNNYFTIEAEPTSLDPYLSNELDD